MPLQEWIDGRAGGWLADRGVTIHRGTPVRQIEGDGRAATGVVLADGTRRRVRFRRRSRALAHSVRGLLSDALRAALPALSGVEDIRPGAITAVHLWFDRPLGDLPHAVLVDRAEPMGLCRPESRERCRRRPRRRHHCQVVISASHALADRDPEEILARGPPRPGGRLAGGPRATAARTIG